MATETERAGLARDLADLPDEELLDVLRRVFSQRRPDPEEDPFNRNRFFLGYSSQMLADDGATWGPWQIGAIAYPDHPHTKGGLGPDYGFCQFGTCRTCGTRVRLNLKQGLCPICDTPLYMT